MNYFLMLHVALYDNGFTVVFRYQVTGSYGYDS